MVRSDVDGSAAGATATMPDAANCEPSPDGSDVTGFREADVHLRPALFFGVIEFFYASDTSTVLFVCYCAIKILIFPFLFSSFFTAFLSLPPCCATFFLLHPFSFHRLTTIDTSLFFFFLFCSAALYSRMFIWRICIIYACCGTPLGSAL